MPEISKQNGIEMGDIAKINEQDVPSGGGGSGTTTGTPTISLEGGTFGVVTVTVTNAHTYTNPNYECIVTAGATTTVADADVDHGGLSGDKDHINNKMNINDTNAATGTRTVSVKAQEFGDLQSSAGTATFDISYLQDRYVRIQSVASAGAATTARTAIDEIRFCTGSGGTGTKYPTTNLTSNTSETGIVVSQGHLYSGSYDAYKACDSNNSSMAWLLGSSAANNWWQIQWESGTYATVPEIKSIEVRFDGNQQTLYFKLMGSSTGSFSGEETNYGVYYISARNATIYYG